MCCAVVFRIQANSSLVSSVYKTIWSYFWFVALWVYSCGSKMLLNMGHFVQFCVLFYVVIFNHRVHFCWCLRVWFNIVWLNSFLYSSTSMMVRYNFSATVLLICYILFVTHSNTLVNHLSIPYIIKFLFQFHHIEMLHIRIHLCICSFYRFLFPSNPYGAHPNVRKSSELCFHPWIDICIENKNANNHLLHHHYYHMCHVYVSVSIVRSCHILVKLFAKYCRHRVWIVDGSNAGHWMLFRCMSGKSIACEHAPNGF